MSRYYDALRRLEKEQRQPGADDLAEPGTQPPELLDGILTEPVEFDEAASAKIEVSPASRFVALTDPRSLGAEKFRSLVTRLENLRQQQELKCLQITSGVINEGKTLVAGNLGVTLATHAGCKVLLLEGDLHRPTLALKLGLAQLPGLSHWWAEAEHSLDRYVYKLDEMSLWFLSAGLPCDQPSQILQSARFVEGFAKLRGHFDWVVVDSTPMSPTVDANLWSRLVDGMLLVVREGVTPVKALESGLAALDNPKLIGVVLNEASEFDQADYESQYYATPRDGNNTVKHHSLFENARTWLLRAPRRRTRRSLTRK
jgi:capsular exopolysaccharide synthesis family protein